MLYDKSAIKVLGSNFWELLAWVVFLPPNSFWRSPKISFFGLYFWVLLEMLLRIFRDRDRNRDRDKHFDRLAILRVNWNCTITIFQS